MLNPLSMVRRVVGLGALAAMGLVGAKSWLDEQRAELRRDYYLQLFHYFDAAGLAGCQTRAAMIDAAETEGWTSKEVVDPSICTKGAESYLRLIPKKEPFVTKEPGFVVAFDAKGCRIKMTYSGC